MFSKILIANRGEIAVRIARTARQLGIASVAIYSSVDSKALHVEACDEAYCIGAAAASESYLNATRILEVASQCAATAIHPGYGFLSENASFARACEAAGIVFIGPPASAIESMGSKSRAKVLMEAAGVPLIPGYHGDQQQDDKLAAESKRVGYPQLIKASAGGGGKGMRLVEAEEDFAEALHSARREACAAFGDDKMLIECYLGKPRHVEIQILPIATATVCIYSNATVRFNAAIKKCSKKRPRRGSAQNCATAWARRQSIVPKRSVTSVPVRSSFCSMRMAVFILWK